MVVTTKNTFQILFFKYKDYTHNYGRVKKISQPHNFIY